MLLLLFSDIAVAVAVAAGDAVVAVAAAVADAGGPKPGRFGANLGSDPGSAAGLTPLVADSKSAAGVTPVEAKGEFNKNAQIARAFGK